VTKARRLLVLVAAVVSVSGWALPAAADSWSPPVTVFDGNQPTVWAGASPQSAKIAINAAGYGAALFSELVPGTSALRAAERVPGGAWEVAPEPLTGSGVMYQYGVAIDPAGNAVAVWEDESNSAIDAIKASTWHPGALGWSPPVTLAVTPTEYRENVPVGAEFRMSANDAGQFIVAWQSVTTIPNAGEDMTVWALFGTPTGGFTQATVAGVVHDNDEVADMTTAIGADGVAAIQWTHEYVGALSLTKRSDIEVAVGSSASGFAQPPNAVTDLSDGSWAEGGDVAVDATGDVLSMFWQSLTSTSPTLSSDYSVDTRYRPAGGPLGPLQKVAEVKDTWNTNHIAVSFDGQGNALATWTSLEPLGLISNTPTTYTATRPAGASSRWAAPTLLTTSTGAFPQIAEAADGSAIIVFDSSSTGESGLYFARTGSGPFDGGQALPCIGAGISIASDDDAAAACRGPHDHSDQIATRGIHDSPLVAAPSPQPTSAATASGANSHKAKSPAGSKVTLTVGLRSARVARGRLVLHGIAKGTGSVKITIRRHGRKKAVESVRVKLKGGAWSRTLPLPRRLAAGTYTVIASGTHVRGGRATFRVARR
jgi:hypothetical protein